MGGICRDSRDDSRPHTRQPFNDAVIAEITEQIAASVDNALARATRTAESLSDDDLAERALELIHDATATATAP